MRPSLNHFPFRLGHHVFPLCRPTPPISLSSQVQVRSKPKEFALRRSDFAFNIWIIGPSLLLHRYRSSDKNEIIWVSNNLSRCVLSFPSAVPKPRRANQLIALSAEFVPCTSSFQRKCYTVALMYSSLLFRKQSVISNPLYLTRWFYKSCRLCERLHSPSIYFKTSVEQCRQPNVQKCYVGCLSLLEPGAAR